MAAARKSARITIFGCTAANVDDLKSALAAENDPNLTGTYSSNVAGGSLSGFIGAAGVVYSVTLNQEDPTGAAIDGASIQNVLSVIPLDLPAGA